MKESGKIKAIRADQVQQSLTAKSTNTTYKRGTDGKKMLQNQTRKCQETGEYHVVTYSGFIPSRHGYTLSIFASAFMTIPIFSSALCQYLSPVLSHTADIDSCVKKETACNKVIPLLP